jgi:hypothetical protein
VPDPDRVQPVVQESAANGGGAESDPDFLQKPLTPQQDALEAAGLYVQEPGQPRDGGVLIRREGGEMLLRDKARPERTLSDILALSSVVIASSGELVYVGDGAVVEVP